jgi:integrase
MRGHIRKRSPGSWTVEVSGGFSDGGQRVRVSRTVRGSKADAQRELTRIQRDVDQGLVADPGRMTLARYLEDRWLPHVATRVRPTTLERYASLLRRHIEPRIGRVRLAKLRPMHIQTALDGMLADGLAPRTCQHAYRVLSSALRQGVRWQVIATNPAMAVSPARPERPTLTVPDPRAVRAILTAAEGSAYHVPLTLCATAGLRRGEALGLRWRDVRLDKATISVVSSLQRSGGELRFVEPKTDRARRTVSLPPFAVELLRRHKKEQTKRRLLLGEAWVDEDVVSDRGDGRPIEPGELSRAFNRLAGDGVRLHDLRHAFATTLLEAGVHPKVASEALGHASVAFTMDTYQHVTPTMGEQVASAMQAALMSHGHNA